jgi:hypothetical protein
MIHANGHFDDGSRFFCDLGEISDLFQPADIPSQPEQPVVSTLAMQLEEDGISIDSLFSEYARFNGEVTASMSHCCCA